jgi:hypothetical protein
MEWGSQPVKMKQEMHTKTPADFSQKLEICTTFFPLIGLCIFI